MRLIDKGIIMNLANQQPSLTQEGVSFEVKVEYIGHQCFVTNEALHKLSELKSGRNTDADMLSLFYAYEATIGGVARRLVAAGVTTTPLVMSPATFGAPRTQ